MYPNFLLPDSGALALDQIHLASASLTLTVRTMAASADCPQCQHHSTRVHSRYRRTLSDVPCTGLTLRLDLRLRRFFCQQSACPRQIFTERLPTVVAPYARRTSRLCDALRLIAFALGGEAGARTATRLGMRTSSDTLLRLLRRSSGETPPSPRVLGVDEWSYKRGQRYGTMVCDLERHCVVDLLPDRSAESWAEWLRQHPGVEIISRDRSTLYAEGAREGAPEAVQVADRWHLMKNLREALERILEAHHAELRRAHQQLRSAESNTLASDAAAPLPSTPDAPPRSPRHEQEASQHRRSRRWARYEEVVGWQQEGLSQREMARRLGLSRRTVQRWLQAGCFPEPSRRPRRSRLDRFRPYLEQRWQEGIRNVAQLWRELQKQGFTGGYTTLKDWQRRHGQNSSTGAAPLSPVKRSAPPSPRQVAWWVLTEASDRTPEQQAFVEELNQQIPTLASVAAQGRAFLDLIRQRREDQLTLWMETAAVGPLRLFVERLRQDEAALRAALRLEWSNGQVEGQVHRLKLLKRQMYGRAHFDLLRRRVLFRT